MRSSAALFALACLLPACVLPSKHGGDESGGHATRLSDEPLPLQVERVPERPRPVLELGDPFLGTGPIGEGVTLPTGAVLQPSFLVFGNLRTALQTFDDGDEVTSEWASRLDLFGNLQLSGTERLLVGVRPLDEDGRFTRYTFEPSNAPDGDGWESEVNAEITTLFLEGDFGEVFPGLDSRDSKGLDWGFSIGRQPLLFQDGLLINDRIDALGITRNTLLPSGASNLRTTGLIGWNEIHRDDNREDDDALLIGLFNEIDLPRSTVSIDAVWVNDDESNSDALYAGVGAVQRIGHTNTAFRAVVSKPIHDDTPEAGEGVLLFAEVSRNPVASDDLVYATLFLGLDHYSSAARGPETGGPLGRAGILFDAVGIGRYGAALGNRADEAVGGAIGWQSFLGDDLHRRQLVLEIGGRADTSSDSGVALERADAIAAGVRFQHAFGRHALLRVDGFVAGREDFGPSAGARTELQLKF